MGINLGHLASGTSHDEFSYECRHSRSPIGFLGEVEGLEEPSVSTGGDSWIDCTNPFHASLGM